MKTRPATTGLVDFNLTTSRRRALLAGFASLLLAYGVSANQWWSESGVGLSGTTHTYYSQPSPEQCQQDCLNTEACRGATWIPAGAANSRDPAMCYLLSHLTSSFNRAGYVSMVKPATPGDVAFRPPHVSGVAVDHCAVWANNCGWGGAHQLCQTQGYPAARSYQLNRPGRTYVLGDRRVCDGAGCVGFSEVVCIAPSTTVQQTPPATPPTSTTPPSTALVDFLLRTAFKRSDSHGVWRFTGDGRLQVTAAIWSSPMTGTWRLEAANVLVLTLTDANETTRYVFNSPSRSFVAGVTSAGTRLTLTPA